MPSSKKDQATPLAAAAVASYRTTSSDEEDPSKWQPHTHPNSTRRRLILCCGCCSALVVVAAVVLLAVALTLYKIREPEMTMNSITINSMNISGANVSARLTADVSVKNRNPATFYFDASVTSLYYRGDLVGKAVGPAGRSAGRRTFRMNITVDVASLPLLSDPKLAVAVLWSSRGAVTVDTATFVGGHVMVFGIFRHHVDVMMNCTVAVGVFNQSIVDQSCRQRVWV